MTLLRHPNTDAHREAAQAYARGEPIRADLWFDCFTLTHWGQTKHGLRDVPKDAK